MLTHSAKKLTNQIPLPGPSLEWMPLPTVTRAIKLACAMCEAPQRFKEAALSTLPGSQLFQAPKGVLSLSAGTSSYVEFILSRLRCWTNRKHDCLPCSQCVQQGLWCYIHSSAGYDSMYSWQCWHSLTVFVLFQSQYLLEYLTLFPLAVWDCFFAAILY